MDQPGTRRRAPSKVGLCRKPAGVVPFDSSWHGECYGWQCHDSETNSGGAWCAKKLRGNGKGQCLMRTPLARAATRLLLRFLADRYASRAPHIAGTEPQRIAALLASFAFGWWKGFALLIPRQLSYLCIPLNTVASH